MCVWSCATICVISISIIILIIILIILVISMFIVVIIIIVVIIFAGSRVHADLKLNTCFAWFTQFRILIFGQQRAHNMSGNITRTTHTPNTYTDLESVMEPRDISA